MRLVLPLLVALAVELLLVVRNLRGELRVQTLSLARARADLRAVLLVRRLLRRERSVQVRLERRQAVDRRARASHLNLGVGVFRLRFASTLLGGFAQLPKFLLVDLGELQLGVQVRNAPSQLEDLLVVRAGSGGRHRSRGGIVVRSRVGQTRRLFFRRGVRLFARFAQRQTPLELVVFALRLAHRAPREVEVALGGASLRVGRVEVRARLRELAQQSLGIPRPLERVVERSRTFPRRGDLRLHRLSFLQQAHLRLRRLDGGHRARVRGHVGHVPQRSLHRGRDRFDLRRRVPAFRRLRSRRLRVLFRSLRVLGRLGRPLRPPRPRARALGSVARGPDVEFRAGPSGARRRLRVGVVPRDRVVRANSVRSRIRRFRGFVDARDVARDVDALARLGRPGRLGRLGRLGAPRSAARDALLAHRDDTAARSDARPGRRGRRG